MSQAVSSQLNQSYAVTHLGPLTELQQFVFEAKERSLKAEGKVFLGERLGLTSAEISFNSLPPKTSIPFYHKHQLNEEIYLFIQGAGEFQVDGNIFSVQEGSVVRVSPDGERCLRNISESDRLIWIVVQARAESYDNPTISDGVGVQKRVSWLKKH